MGDGRSHLMDFAVNERPVGTGGSELKLDRPGTVKLRVKAAAYLPEEQTAEGKKIAERPYADKPYWDIERARIGTTRKVPVEVIVNGRPVEGARRELVADGTPRDLEFDVPIEQSSWVALRILASCHTNPVFVVVGDKPIRASRRSADWCIRSIDECWTKKEPLIRESEKAEAKKAYEEAKEIYAKIMEESATD